MPQDSRIKLSAAAAILTYIVVAFILPGLRLWIFVDPLAQPWLLMRTNPLACALAAGVLAYLLIYLHESTKAHNANRPPQPPEPAR